MLVELARIGGAEQRLVDDRDLLDAAHGALELEAAPSVNSPSQPRSVSSASASRRRAM